MGAAAAAQQSGPATLKVAPPQASTARMESFLGGKEKVRGEWKTMYCVLQKSILSMYPTKEIAEAGRQPFRTVSSLTRIIGTLNRIIGTLNRIIGTLDRIIGTLIRVVLRCRTPPSGAYVAVLLRVPPANETKRSA